MFKSADWGSSKGSLMLRELNVVFGGIKLGHKTNLNRAQ